MGAIETTGTGTMSIRVLNDTAIRYFLQVVHAGSISEAASRLHVVPSAVSRQISRLETELGVILFERTSRGMSLSQAGEILAAYARRTTLDAEHVSRDIDGLRQKQEKLIRVACTEGFSSDYLPKAFAAFREGGEMTTFHLRVTSASGVTQLVREGEVDIGFSFSLGLVRDIHVAYRQASPLLALVAPSHVLANESSVTLRTLLAHPLAMPGPTSTIRQLFDIYCSREGLSYKSLLDSDNLEALVAFAVTGSAIAFASELFVATRLKTKQLVALRISDIDSGDRCIEVQTLARRELPAHILTFLDIVRASLQALQSDSRIG